jgi:hypothetical protein
VPIGIGFKKFGWINFTPYTKVEAFADSLKSGKLQGTRCKNCGKAYFPPRADCVKCMSSEFEWIDYSGNCTLISYTTIHAAPTGFEELAPYTLGVVELEEGGRLLAWVEDVNESELKIGMKLKVVPKIFEEIEELKVGYVLKKA